MESAVSAPLRVWSFAYVAITPEDIEVESLVAAGLEARRVAFPAIFSVATRGLGAATVSPPLALPVSSSVLRKDAQGNWTVDTMGMLQAFYARFPDSYDYLVLAIPSGKIGAGGSTGSHTTLRTVATGTYPTTLGFPRNWWGVLPTSRAVGYSVIAKESLLLTSDVRPTELHEFIHQFCCELRFPGDALPSRTSPYLPLAGVAVDGASHWAEWVTGQAGIVSRCGMAPDFVANGDGTYSLNYVPRSRIFSDLELYVLGLLPASAVRPTQIFVPQPVPAPLFPWANCLSYYGRYVITPRTLTIDDVLAVNGPRVEIATSALALYDRLRANLGPQPGYHSAWLTQSEYPTMRPGESRLFWIAFRNSGSETWKRGVWGQQVNLGLNGDNRAPYDLGMADSWLWQDRIATTIQTEVRPGELGVFAFRLRAPLQAGVYSLNLRPVADGTVWLEDEGVFWNLVVQ